jgi:hypothetical protein
MRSGAMRAALRTALAGVVVALTSAQALSCTPPAGALLLQGAASGVWIQPVKPEVGKPFVAVVHGCNGQFSPTQITRIDAHMPDHRHGMNYQPTLAVNADGSVTAQGMLFHMPGKWEFIVEMVADLAVPQAKTRLTHVLVIE